MSATDIMTSFQNFGIITFVTKAFNEGKKHSEKIDKTSMQKLIYIIQEINGVTIGYDFKLYNYGPYSADLAGDIEYTEYLKGIEEHFVTEKTSYSDYILDAGQKYYEIITEAKIFLENGSKEKIAQAINSLRDFSPKELDLIATIHKIFHQLSNEEKNKESLINKTKLIKPKADREMVEKIIDYLLREKAIAM